MSYETTITTNIPAQFADTSELDGMNARMMLASSRGILQWAREASVKGVTAEEIMAAVADSWNNYAEMFSKEPGEGGK